MVDADQSVLDVGLPVLALGRRRLKARPGEMQVSTTTKRSKEGQWSARMEGQRSVERGEDVS
jgi:hypothetical protein